MIGTFFQGFIFGLGAAVPLGPVNILIMNTALKNYKAAVSIGFGALSADLTYLILVSFGLVTFLNHPLVLEILGYFGAGFLVFISYLLIKHRNDELKQHTRDVSKKNLAKAYLGGYFLTLLNPYTIAFWVSVASFAVSKDHQLAMILGLIFSIALWVTLMPYAVYKTKHKISINISSKIAVVAAVILFGFGVSLFFKTLLS